MLWLVPDPKQARALALALVYLVMALSELVAPFVPTLFLLAAVPLTLGPSPPGYCGGATSGARGLPLMIIGCVVVTLSGAWFLGLIGIR